jgi:hypothetical protein
MRNFPSSLVSRLFQWEITSTHEANLLIRRRCPAPSRPVRYLSPRVLLGRSASILSFALLRYLFADKCNVLYQRRILARATIDHSIERFNPRIRRPTFDRGMDAPMFCVLDMYFGDLGLTGSQTRRYYNFMRSICWNALIGERLIGGAEAGI